MGNNCCATPVSKEDFEVDILANNQGTGDQQNKATCSFDVEAYDEQNYERSDDSMGYDQIIYNSSNDNRIESFVKDDSAIVPQTDQQQQQLGNSGEILPELRLDLDAIQQDTSQLTSDEIMMQRRQKSLKKCQNKEEDGEEEGDEVNPCENPVQLQSEEKSEPIDGQFLDNLNSDRQKSVKK